ncbi:Beta-1,3-galactosyl-O-glycosyl-glycoprotein beta-1,6-N-acetylglucosaminyltransferase 3 [Aphelenchoides besseyi]|nr:Beta-1,3-galactosyl-O-glycosyl-glycoprotein beta-1,6-N-acetylglucosaminyltransferase 3 [Aphelenchoides besseyi]
MLPLCQSERSNQFYIKPKEAVNLNCPSFFLNSKADLASYASTRIKISDPKNETDLPMDCKAIRQRAYFQTDDLYPEEAEFPIAYARTVYRDYRSIEIGLAAIYNPHNFYCYALDAKSSPLFHKRMRTLAGCFPNVFLTAVEFPMDSSGHNITYSYHQCMLTLTKKEYKWKYLIMLQNDEIPLKTNQELIHIFKLFNGTNDVASVELEKIRIDPNANWTFKSLKLFKNETRNRVSHNGYAPILPITSSQDFVSVSRAMIDFMLQELDLRVFIKNLEQKNRYGVDEQFMASLNSADAIDAPGGYTRFCYDKKLYHTQATIYVIWKPCKEGYDRHGVCVFGMEHLQKLLKLPHLFANKMIPSYDFGAMACWYEEFSRRTHVRFNRERNQLGSKFNVSNFACVLDHHKH